MNWTTFQLHNLSQEKAFEAICNQLFENWCREEYDSDIVSLNVVNGAGGDGGVESYAVLSNDSIVALQAKCFFQNIKSSHIAQIRNSIKTAMEVRPNIIRYIVCVPRDLTSTTVKSDNSESKRWDNLLAEIKNDYPYLSVELWNDTKITTELQKPDRFGIFKFWFEKNEISRENIVFSFDKAKNSWLNTKYEPDLNTEGNIEKHLQIYLGNSYQNKLVIDTLKNICKLCSDFFYAANELLILIGDKNKEFSDQLSYAINKLECMRKTSICAIDWLQDDSIQVGSIDGSAFDFYFGSLIESINDNKDLDEYYFHKSDVIKPLKQLSQIDCYDLLEYIALAKSKKSILFLGDPGTGKTHGVSAFSEKILSANLHLPLLIQAKDISEDRTWKQIIQTALGIGDNWNEEEIWQGLTSLVNRYRLYENNLKDDIKIVPKFLVIIDGLDEFSTSEKWQERIKQANVISQKYPQIRFCFTARPLVFKFSIDWAIVKRVGRNGDVPAYKLFDTYVKKYNVTAQNTGWLKYALSTPLALKMFCELNRNKCVDYTRYSDVAIPNLWRKKIENIEQEFDSRENVSTQNQYVLNAVDFLAGSFIETGNIERQELLKCLSEKLSITQLQAEKLLKCFEAYGIVNNYCKKGTGILPDKYFYYPGIQGYFDYATAVLLIEKFDHPKKIDLSKCKIISHNVLYGLAVVSIQQYGYLITDNRSIFEVIGERKAEEIQFYALQHTDSENAIPYIQRVQEFMAENATKLITVVNKLVLPLSRYEGHPLGINLLDNFLNSFDKPAQRDIIWSIQRNLRDAYGLKWYQRERLALEKEEYILTSDDKHYGCPVVYAWALSTIDNSMRKIYRDRLTKWACLVPDEFFKLFLKFAQNNDPQICSDIYSILVCVVYECADEELTASASKWLCSNVLHPDKIDSNRDISIRYYSIAIIRKAVLIGIFTQEEADAFLPPYVSTDYNIELNKEALSGTRLGGYSEIDYDLARYVLIDHFQYAFEDYIDEEGGKFFELIKKVAENQPEYTGITTEQFILSAAYAYILKMGWNEDEFCTQMKGEGDNFLIGVDSSILATYFSATHGEKSPVMTVCEKYVWQARNYISGFLCDRLSFGEENLAISDYGLLDDFIIPTQEIRQIDPDNIPIENPWHIPESDKVIMEGDHNSKEDVISKIKNAPTIDWEKWLFTENDTRKFKPECDQLLALCMYSDFLGSAGVETRLFVNSILINKADIPLFLSIYSSNERLSNQVYDPSDWYGGNESSCYITPKEICWFPWKTHYDSYNTEEFPGVSISSATDKCVYNFLDWGDVYYYMPSPDVRGALNICDTDGYIYYDMNKSIKAEYCIAGEKFKTFQDYLWVDRGRLLNLLDGSNRSIVWILKEIRRRSGKSQEKYGQFYAECEKVSIGYFNDGKFITKEVKDDFICSEGT